MSLTLHERLRRLPPVAIRLLARKPTGKSSSSNDMSDEEIARRSGLPMADVKSLSWALSWDDVPVAKMLAFSKGCGIQLDNRLEIRRAWVMLKRGSGSYLRRSPRWESQYKELVKHYLASESISP
jgi:hypothetical protein